MESDYLVEAARIEEELQFSSIKSDIPPPWISIERSGDRLTLVKLSMSHLPNIEIRDGWLYARPKDPT